MRALGIQFVNWRKPCYPRQPGHPRGRFSLVRARASNGSSPGWHLWIYTYPNGVQRGRLITIYGRWVGKRAAL